MRTLKQACEDAAATKSLPRCSEPIAIERAARHLSARPTGTTRNTEGWADFLARIDPAAPEQLKPEDLKRLLYDMWNPDMRRADPSLNKVAPPVLEQSVAQGRKSIDRTIIAAYLWYFPRSHPSFKHLTHACALVAGRHDWPWRERGDTWAMWNPDQGPARLSQALLDNDNPAQLLRDAGLDGDLATGNFVKKALVEACRVAAGHRNAIAQQSGQQLIDLFEDLPKTEVLNASLTWALLAPWRQETCDEVYQRRIRELLISRNGDPRQDSARWGGLRRRVLRIFPDAQVDDAFAVLRRWLVGATMREFFQVVAETTERPDQWKERTDFWLAYLDAGYIDEAWFVFGKDAEQRARKIRSERGNEDSSARYAKFGGTTTTSSVLFFSIGDIRIAEWSDNGKCRFWHKADQKAPDLYLDSYEEKALRATKGGEGFRAISHTWSRQRSSWQRTLWQQNFARYVYDVTGVRHPKLGAG